MPTIKDATIDQLKVAAYDNLVMIENLQRQNQAINAEIAQRLQTPTQQSVPTPTEVVEAKVKEK